MDDALHRAAAARGADLRLVLEALQSAAAGRTTPSLPHSALATGAADQAMFFGDLPPFARAAAAAVGGEGGEESLRQRSPRFDAAAVNLYRPGDALTPHIDLTPRYRDGVAIVSLGGAVVVQFERVDADSPPATARALLRPGDILTMAGPARYTWTHGFAGGEGAWRGRRVERARVRVGVTLRRLRPDP